VGINKLGGQARNFPTLVNETFQSNNHVIMFPAGLCSRLIDGQIHDIPWTKAFISKSVQTQRDIVPVHFIGENSPRFYRIAQWCKRLRLKFNIAMVTLPDEMYRSRGKHYTVRFGKPTPHQTFDSSRTPAQWAQWVEEEVYKI
jgi:putative hemolysin